MPPTTEETSGRRLPGKTVSQGLVERLEVNMGRQASHLTIAQLYDHPIAGSELSDVHGVEVGPDHLADVGAWGDVSFPVTSVAFNGIRLVAHHT